MKIVVKKVPKFLRGFVKLIFGIKDEKWYIEKIQKNKIGATLFLFLETIIIATTNKIGTTIYLLSSLYFSRT